jgi:PAS domain S-box-containing protein
VTPSPPPDREQEARAQNAHARHLELLSEHANDVVLLVDERGRIVRANERVRECYGWTSAELAGVHMRELRDEGQREHLDKQIARIRAEGSLRYETVHRRRDGTPFPVEVSARGFEANGAWFLQAIVRDVTERREVLRTLSYQAELLQHLHDAVVALDADHVVRSWNAAAEEIYGIPAGEAIGRRMAELFQSEYRGCTYAEFVERLDRSERMTYQVRRGLRDGSFVDVEASAVVLRGEAGGITGYVTVNRDVTLRKRAEAALRASQERLSRILETSSEGVWIVDARGVSEFVNDRAARLFGLCPEEAVGRPLLEMIPEEGRAPARADLEAISRGEAVKRELALRRADGSEVWLNVSWTALRGADGGVAGGVGLFVDVTEHRRAREQLLQSQKMEAIGRLASGIAHDFNNLLVSILTCSSFLLEALPDHDERREDAAEIKRAGERAAQLVRQLLAFGRKSALVPVVCDVNRAVRRVETILRRVVGERVTLSVALHASWPTRIDPGLLEQVIMNLAVNARDAMPGGGELRISTRDVTLDHAQAHDQRLAPGRYAVLEVADTGCGIGPEVLPKVFEPFFTTKEEGRGTGLGLSTVYGVVQEAGGGVAVSSAVGHGTTFAVYLPACAAEERADDAPRAPRLHAVGAAGGARRSA